MEIESFMRALDQVIYYNSRVKKQIAVGDYSEAERCACKTVKYIFEEAPTLGLDIDGTIDESLEFMQLLSRTWPGEVIIITARNDHTSAVEDLARWGIEYDRLITVSKLDQKADIIRQHGVNVYVDDQDECIANIDSSVTVLKIRNGGNFEQGRWLYSTHTGINIDEQ